jgi:hypothetical protein
MSCSNYKTINQPMMIPFLSSLSETQLTQGQSNQPIYINGSNFSQDSVVMMDMNVCVCFYNGSNQLGFLIPWNKMIKTTGDVSVQVTNPGKNGTYLTSNVLFIQVIQ